MSIFLGALVTLEHAKLDIADQAPPMVPVDLVTVGEKTNIAPTVKEEPKLQQEQIEEQSHDLVPPNLPAIQEQAEPAPSEAAAQPVQAKQEPLPVPKAKPKRLAEKENNKKTDEDFSALLNKLTAPSAAPRNAKVASRTQRGFGEQSAMTMDLADSISNQIAQCWNPQIGAPRSEELVVDFALFLNPDGSVAQPPQLTASSRAAVASDPYTRAAADAARRAIYQCQPYKLPADRYSQWREINPFHFDPSRMMGQ